MPHAPDTSGDAEPASGAVSELQVSEPVVAEPDAPIHRVPEAVVQDVWRRQLFDARGWATTEGLPIVVLNPGTLNHGSGPDFSQASIRIGHAPNDLLWAGDVEIHRTSSDWNRHRHQDDPAYRRVVLHVVLSPDSATGTIRRDDGTVLPEAVLLPRLDRPLRTLIHDFYAQPDGSAPYCAPQWISVPLAFRQSVIRTTGLQRLRDRASRFARRYGKTPSTDRLLVAALFRALGYAPNADAMEDLAHRLPLGLARSLDAPEDIHALLIGLAGLAETPLFADDHKTRFLQLAAAHDLPTPLTPEAWRHGGRPANAPRRRLAQAAAMISAAHGARGLLRDEPLARLRAALFSAKPIVALRDEIRASVVDGVPGIGKARADVALVNAVLPVLLLDAEFREDHEVEPHVVALLETFPPEADRVTRAFADAGLDADSLLDSQGIHHLAASYCEEGRCARCQIGQHLYPALVGV